jgi:rhamnosyltransferase
MKPVLGEVEGQATVSVLLVTKNGERYLDEVLSAVKSQKGDAAVAEIIAVDSGSRDRSLEILHRHRVRVVQIPAQEFGHGKTRNLAASHARGDYLVFLTQDATPAGDQWLQNLVAPLPADPRVVGAYSRQLPRSHCHPMEWRRIVELELSGRAESRINAAADNPEYAHNPALFYFFSNVSSAVRRTVWEEFPFPEIEFAEDQLWAKQVLETGYKTVYCADSLVYHSHGYGPWANFRRHFDHARAVEALFAHPPQVVLKEALFAAWRMTREDLRFWCRQNGQGKRRVWLRWGVLALSWHLAAFLGTWLGERGARLPPGFVRALSLQEGIKRQ